MRRNYEQGSPEDVMDRFDREALWEHIGGQLPTAPVKRYYLGWITHAAAALAGVLLVLLFYPKPGKEQLLSALRTSYKPVIGAPAATAVISGAVIPVRTPPPAGKNPKKHFPSQPADTIVLSPPDMPLVRSDKRLPPDAIAPDTVAVKTVVLQVRHLLDFANEDRQLIDGGSCPRPAKSLLLRLNMPGGTMEEQAPIALRRFLNINE